MNFVLRLSDLYQLHLHEKNTKQKSCSTIPKNKGAFVAVTSALVDIHCLTLVVEFQFIAFKNQSEYYNCIANSSLPRAD